MLGRDRQEEHRSATPLELFFDLCFVVAVAQAAAELHHELALGEIGHAVAGYLAVFFAIWWAWMNFTWFASAYDVDDVPYRLLTLLQMAGVLVLAAGVKPAFAEGDFNVVVVGYVIMRMAMVAQWLRVAREHREGRGTALRFALAITIVQIGWVLRLLLPGSLGWPSFVALAAAEIAVPIWAERRRPTVWHPEHIAERYGLFTIIVLGESILASTVAVQAASEEGVTGSLVAIALGGLMIVFGLWWSYFKRPMSAGLVSNREGFIWGYGHYAVFASGAALGAGIQVAVDNALHHSELSAVGNAMSVAVPVAIFLVVVGGLQTALDHTRPVFRRFTVCAVLVLIAASLAGAVGVPATVLTFGVLVWLLIAADLMEARRATR
ncbi:MAG: low temperature requirement protein A [Candidatus Nanopelagicales bacterium]